ncbi:hypothetical protein HKD37_16G045340 [Glycine soja]
MCNRLPETCNRLPVKNFRKNFLKRHISLNHFEKARRAYICVSDFKKQERYSKRTSLSNALSITLGQTLANLLRVHPETSNCIIHSTLKERNLFVLLRKSIVIKRLVVS